MDVTKREAIRSGWGIEPYDGYGAVEIGNIAFECPSRSGSYHFHADHLFLEVLRPNGSAAGEGEVGEVVVTSLAYQAMPLIRYRLGDLAALGSSCSCGSPLPTLQSLHGRSDDVITLASGRRLTPLAVNRVFCGSNLRRYRLKQRAPGRFNLEIDGEIKAASAAGRAFREILGPEDEVEMSRVTLPPGQAKERTIVVEVP
jgi:phenylacetate-CoA ligase